MSRQHLRRQRRRPGLLRALCCSAVLLALAGCGVKLAYNNLDRLARWSVSDYSDMNDPQRAYFDARFETLWGWHRREHLPQYAVFLDSASARLEDATSEAQMQALVDQIFAWADEIETRALPMAAELLASLTDAQVERLTRALEESNREMAEPEEDATPEEAQALWRESFSDNFTRFSGRLTAVQKAYLEEQSTRYRPERVLWAEYRRRWQQDFLALLERRGEPDRLERELRRLSVQREDYFGDELAEVYDHNNRLAREVSVWLVNSLTERQRDRFSDRLEELAEDFRELAAQAAPAGEAPAAPCLVRC